METDMENGGKEKSLAHAQNKRDVHDLTRGLRETSRSVAVWTALLQWENNSSKFM